MDATALPSEAEDRRSRSPRRSRRRAAPLLVHRIEIGLKHGHLDPAGLEARHDLIEAGLSGIEEVRVVRTFFLEGRLSEAEAHTAAEAVLRRAVKGDLNAGRGDALVAVVGLLLRF